MQDRIRLSGRARALLAVLVSSVACSSAPEPEEMRATERPLLSAGGQEVLWPSGVVPYCFVPQGSSAILEQRKQEFREALAQSWASEGVVSFPERACDSTTVRVSFANLGSNAAGLAGVGRYGGLQLGLQLHTSYLQTSSPLDFKWVVAHEMGHILGFRHEQDQQGSTCNLGRDYSGTGVPLTGYDPTSVMNYCATRNNDSILSALDREGLRRAYGGSSRPRGNEDPPPPAGPDVNTASEICEPSRAVEPGAQASVTGGSAGTFRLTNQCPNALLVVWLDYQGNEWSFGALSSGAEAVYTVNGGHRFRLRSATTGRFIVDLLMPNGDSVLTMPYR